MAKKSLSLYRSLAVPFSVFVLMASLILGAYISYWSERHALKELEEIAETNAKFIENLQLPRSKAMADKLSTVLGVSVAFYEVDKENEAFPLPEWSGTFHQTLKDATTQSPNTFHLAGKDVAIVPFTGGQTHLLLIRDSRSFFSLGLGSAILIPSVALTIACGCLAFYLAHRLVIPLRTITSWLPYLEHDDRVAPRIDHSVSSRGDEIGELARAIEAAHRKLRDEQARRRQSERMATLGRIATSLAHEIRNPAASIALHADLLARRNEQTDGNSVKMIRAEVDRITGLVNQWLFVVRPTPPQTSSHELTEIVSSITKNMAASLKHSDAKLDLMANSQPVTIRCDRARIEQVIRNLLVNAMQAMPEGGEIRIGFEVDDTLGTLVIHDSGEGFSPEALERFGEPFFSEREGGMGIGLTLAREVIEAHQGRLEAMNAPEGGAVVRLQLPLAESTPT